MLVAEVGLGGRLDATNIITPVISIITSLSLDHMNVLGNTLAEIAGEKCGIIKPGIPVVSSPQQPEALAVIEEHARKKGSPLTLVGRDILFEPVAHSLDRQSMRIWKEKAEADASEGDQTSREVFEIPLLGAHQMDNAATAYAALESMQSDCNACTVGGDPRRVSDPWNGQVALRSFRRNRLS